MSASSEKVAQDRLVEVRAHLKAALEIAYGYESFAPDAPDQPRIRWCVEHGLVAIAGDACALSGHRYAPCRVVDAIVVPLEKV